MPPKSQRMSAPSHAVAAGAFSPAGAGGASGGGVTRRIARRICRFVPGVSRSVSKKYVSMPALPGVRKSQDATAVLGTLLKPSATTTIAGGDVQTLIVQTFSAAISRASRKTSRCSARSPTAWTFS